MSLQTPKALRQVQLPSPLRNVWLQHPSSSFCLSELVGGGGAGAGAVGTLISSLSVSPNCPVTLVFRTSFSLLVTQHSPRWPHSLLFLSKWGGLSNVQTGLKSWRLSRALHPYFQLPRVSELEQPTDNSNWTPARIHELPFLSVRSTFLVLIHGDITPPGVQVRILFSSIPISHQPPPNPLNSIHSSFSILSLL